MPNEINPLTQSYIKIQKCINSQFNSQDYKFFRSLLNENELECLKHLQHLKHYQTYKANTIRKKNQEILDGFINENANDPSVPVEAEKPERKQKKTLKGTDAIVKKTKPQGKTKAKSIAEDPVVESEITSEIVLNIPEPSTNHPEHFPEEVGAPQIRPPDAPPPELEANINT
jgi:hypothetical protein